MPAKTPKHLSPLAEKMRQDIQLAGLAQRTIDSYLRQVRKFAEYINRSPDKATEADLRRYLLYIKNECNFTPSSMNVAYSAIKFFYSKTCPRNWRTLKNLRVQRELKLPTVISVDEVRLLCNSVRKLSMYVFFTSVYMMGLRLKEAIHLQPHDIDSKRMLVHIRGGKGAKDRYVPLPPVLLRLLRKYWATHRNPLWIFPSEGQDHKQASTSTEPVNASSIQACIQQVVKQLGWQRRKISTHTLRHCYATHLSEDNVNLRQIQKYLGHSNIQSTMFYLHLTACGEEASIAKINRLMADGWKEGEENDKK